MASEVLFSKLADALGQPSKAYRAANQALQVPGEAIGGYMDVKMRQQDMAAKKAAALENFGKLADQVGYNRASQIFPLQQFGIDPASVRPSGASANPSAPSPTVTGSTVPGTTPAAPSSSNPNDYSGMVNNALENPDDFGKGQLDRLKTMTGLQQNAPASFDQVRGFFKAANRPEIGESLISDAQRSGKNYVQKDVFDKASGLVGPRSDIATALNRRTDLQVANAINQNVNAFVAKGALGQTGTNNLRLSRVSRLLQRPDPLTPAELDIVNQDIAGVATGGVPLKETSEGQRVATLQSQFAQLQQKFSGHPEVFNDAGFRQRTVRLANEMLAADNAVQEKAFQSVKANYGHLTTPEHLEAVHQAIINGEQLPIVDIQTNTTPGADTPLPGAGSTGDPEADRAIQTILASGLSQPEKNARIAGIKAAAAK